MITSVCDRRLDVVDDLNRRRFIGGGTLLAALLAACGRELNPAPPTGATADDSGFPATLEHKYGATTITEEPKRVITVGDNDQDALLAMGVIPVATTKWLGEYPGAIYPWAQDKLGNAPLPEVLEPSYSADGLQFERIAALRPDLILAVFSSIGQGDYDRLAKIAPTVAHHKDFVDYGAPWQLMTRTLGRAVGQPEQADQLVASVEARFAQARAAHPEFAGGSAVVALYGGDGGSYLYWPPPSTSGQFLADLGFTLPAELAELAGGEQAVELSRERVDLFDTDVLVWLYVDEQRSNEIRADQLYARLDVATQGRDIFLADNDVLTEALTTATVLSMPFALDRLMPHLTAAIDGDPATKPPS